MSLPQKSYSGAAPSIGSAAPSRRAYVWFWTSCMSFSDCPSRWPIQAQETAQNSICFGPSKSETMALKTCSCSAPILLILSHGAFTKGNLHPEISANLLWSSLSRTFEFWGACIRSLWRLGPRVQDPSPNWFFPSPASALTFTFVKSSIEALGTL